MKIDVINNQHDVPIKTLSVRNATKEIIKNEAIVTDEVTIHLVSREYISQLHQDFFGDPTPTDCITFPIDKVDQESEYHILGEVFISPRAAIDFLEEFEQEALYAEVTLYLIHGLLHLAGYNDLEEEERKVMREAEKRHLALLFERDLFLKARLTQK